MELAKSPSLQILRGDLVLRSPAPEVHSLRPLPRLRAQEKERRFNEDNTPFPRDTGMFEDIVVDNLSGSLAA